MRSVWLGLAMAVACSGGGNDRAPAAEWLKEADEFHAASATAPAGHPAIPVIWGSDSVHGNSNIIGATIFPHNIGLGAARDPDLMREIGKVTATETRVVGADWTFAPTIAVVRDDRWGRTYEGYSEDPAIVRDYASAMIEGIQVRFEKGRIVEARATRGQEVLQKLIDTDDGAGRLGEVALVPHSSPIASSGLLFFNTLFDENAASHIALGQAYTSCLRDGDKLTPPELAAKGANESLIHVDWMIGSEKLDIDGITASGTAEPLMRGGEWV